MRLDKKWWYFFFGWVLGSYIGLQMILGRVTGGIGRVSAAAESA